jgi:hypothetical protein
MYSEHGGHGGHGGHGEYGEYGEYGDGTQPNLIRSFKFGRTTWPKLALPQHPLSASNMASLLLLAHFGVLVTTQTAISMRCLIRS